jgi:hypothetical protein
MPRDPRCRETADVVAEVALGIADPDDRSRALEHAAECPACRHELERDAVAADELLALSSDEEPPLGFELRVLRAIQPAAPRERRLFRWLVPVAAAAVAVTLTAGAMLATSRDERRLADQYRAALEQADGEYFGAARLEDAAGRAGGVLFTYRGEPSWLLITVSARHRAMVAQAEIVDVRGRRMPLESFALVDGVWGGALPIELVDLAAVELLRENGRAELVVKLRNPSDAVGR